MSDQWIDLESKYYMQVTRRQPIVLQKGDGVKVWDTSGKEYLDFVAGWAVNSLGHSHPVIVNAIEKQVRELVQVSNQFYSIPQLKLAKLLVESSGMSRAFLCNSGAEANEGAVKLARRYGKSHLNGAFEVISAMNSFHGRTLGMVAATGQPKYQEAFTPLPDGFVNVEYDSFEEIEKATNERTCAILLEPLQGEGGVNVPSPDYFNKVREWCDKKSILLILDEVQTGMGRLGNLFGFQGLGIQPDILVLAKGLGGGVPIGAFLANEKADAFLPGDHGSTFGGNPLTCAVALAVGEFIISNDITSHVSNMGRYMAESLGHLKSKYKNISDVRGLGLLQALEFNDDVAADVVTACNKEGILINPVKPNAIRLMPPLIITKQEIDEGLSRLESAISTVFNNGAKRNK